MDSHNLHQRSSAGGRHASIDIEGNGTNASSGDVHANGNGLHSEHEFHYPVHQHVPTLRVQTHAVGQSPRHGTYRAHGGVWGLSPRRSDHAREREAPTALSRLQKAIGFQAQAGSSSSPRRRAALKAKSSDANLVHLGGASSMDHNLNGDQLQWLSNSIGLAKAVALLLAGLLILGILLAKPYHSVKTKLWCSAVKSKKKALADQQGFMTPFEPYSRAYAAMHYAEPSVLNNRQGQYMCARVMEFEQIGLLFLTHERIRNEVAWARWFEGARGKIPLGRGRLGRCLHTGGHVMNVGLNIIDEDFEDVPAACGVSPDETNPISSQFLFDVWVHLKKGEDRDIFRDSIFESRLIPDESRVAATWGGHSLIDATRVLFAASLSNPLVSKMILVSDSDVPLYGPAMVYNQLVNEEKSRVNACNTTAGWDRNEYRLRYDFIESGISWATWRKSWQWVALTRSHASLVMRDTEVDSIFRMLCRARWDHDWCDFRVCYSDEHYIPTLLAIHGLDNETDCIGELTDKDWSRVKSTDAHPWEYQAKEINEALFTRLRHPEVEGCERSMLIQSGISAQFTTSESLISVASRGEAAKATQGKPLDICTLAREVTYNRVPSFVPLGPRCPLLARKFAHDTSIAIESIAGWIFGEE